MKSPLYLRLGKLWMKPSIFWITIVSAFSIGFLISFFSVYSVKKSAAFYQKAAYILKKAETTYPLRMQEKKRKNQSHSSTFLIDALEKKDFGLRENHPLLQLANHPIFQAHPTVKKTKMLLQKKRMQFSCVEENASAQTRYQQKKPIYAYPEEIIEVFSLLDKEPSYQLVQASLQRVATPGLEDLFSFSIELLEQKNS